jgi:hypothetical protein
MAPNKTPRFRTPVHRQLVASVEERAGARKVGELLRAAGISSGAWAQWKKGSAASLETVELLASGAGECLTLVLDPDPARSGVHFGASRTGGLVLKYPESRQVAVIVDGLDEQGRREVFDFALRYARAVAANPQKPAPQSASSLRAREP